ncbi:hypothetical protein Fot_32516 [Forsythia ovata]|uniref:Uncharacterized protein n=1 Tax=Forsythia ovata TaxID=205694 RepID=A0ABD1T846_9LAMI
MVDNGGNSLEEIGRTAPENMVVIVEPVMGSILHPSSIREACGCGLPETGSAYLQTQFLKLQSLGLYLIGASLSSNTLPKIDLASLATKKISPVMRGKEVDNSQKWNLASMSPKADDQSSDSLATSNPK